MSGASVHPQSIDTFVTTCCHMSREEFNADPGGYTRKHADNGRLNDFSGLVIGTDFTSLDKRENRFPVTVSENAMAKRIACL